MRRPKVTLEVVHSDPQGVRFEFFGSCLRTEALMLYGKSEVATLQRQDFVVEFRGVCDELDHFSLRAVPPQRPNDYSWGYFSNLRLVT